MADTAIALWGASLNTGHFIAYPDLAFTRKPHPVGSVPEGEL